VPNKTTLDICWLRRYSSQRLSPWHGILQLWAALLIIVVELTVWRAHNYVARLAASLGRTPSLYVVALLSIPLLTVDFIFRIIHLYISVVYSPFAGSLY
jgi:hypothetical protein